MEEAEAALAENGIIRKQDGKQDAKVTVAAE
jgi:hypothetical protein